jgi:hypothetical protein
MRDFGRLIKGLLPENYILVGGAVLRFAGRVNCGVRSMQPRIPPLRSG